jgi:hypothetical protein
MFLGSVVYVKILASCGSMGLGCIGEFICGERDEFF